jgi:hypothetical protein
MKSQAKSWGLFLGSYWQLHKIGLADIANMFILSEKFAALVTSGGALVRK